MNFAQRVRRQPGTVQHGGCGDNIRLRVPRKHRAKGAWPLWSLGGLGRLPKMALSLVSIMSALSLLLVLWRLCCLQLCSLFLSSQLLHLAFFSGIS